MKHTRCVLVISILLLVLLAPSIPTAHAAPIACNEAAFRAALDAGGVIDLPAGCTITATGAAGDDANVSGDFDVRFNVTINGAADGSSIIDGGGGDRVFHVLLDVTATFSNITIQNGFAFSLGGGIYNGGTLTLTDSTVSGNNTGGGIYNGGTLTLTDSTVSGNTAGGIFNGLGGGIRNGLGGTLTLTNSTVSGNTAGVGGGGIYNYGTQ